MFGMAAPAAFAETSLADMVSNSIGYVMVRENVILIEGEYDANLCRIEAGNDAFDAYAAEGKLADDMVSVTCIPLEEFKD
ncbi:hypothetical protein J5Y17_10470 [Celeribacter sp. PS-C1]|nr:hypothetical protein [Celeribacter sp. PS-C1]